MGDIFVSYQSADREKVRPLVEALRAEGLDVWWDQDIPVDAVWADAIAAALAQAKAVVVCWSPAAVESENVREEARRARARGLLVQAYIEECEPPLFFGEQQGARLVGWNGDRGNDRFQMLVKGLRAVVAGKPLPGRLSKQIGYKRREGLAGPLLLGAFAVIVAAAAGVLFIEDIRHRIFPPPAVTWSMSAGARADLRPALPPSARLVERFGSSAFIALSPAFTPDRAPRTPASVTDMRLELDIPGAPPVSYAWLYFTSNDEDPAVYIDRTADAGPFTLSEAGAREITFEPTSAFKWSDFVQAINRAHGAGEQYFMLRLTAVLAADGEAPSTLTGECRLPVAPVLERIQRAGLELTWIAVPCGFPAPTELIETTDVDTVTPSADAEAPSAEPAAGDAPADAGVEEAPAQSPAAETATATDPEQTGAAPNPATSPDEAQP